MYGCRLGCCGLDAKGMIRNLHEDVHRVLSAAELDNLQQRIMNGAPIAEYSKEKKSLLYDVLQYDGSTHVIRLPRKLNLTLKSNGYAIDVMTWKQQAGQDGRDVTTDDDWELDH